MHLLLSNDDGYQALGINVLASHLASLGHQITVVAPLGERSAQSHAMSFYHAVQVDKINDNTYAVHGTPADCVAIALSRILKDNPPDFVVSGINHGLNVGIDVNYSGTVGAATEAALMGFKAIAVSADSSPFRKNQEKLTELFLKSAKLVGAVLEKHNSFQWPKLQILNINLPQESRAVRVGGCGGESLYVPNVEEISISTRAHTKLYFIGGTKRYEPNDMSQDVSLISSGFATLSFIQAKQSSTGHNESLRSLESLEV